MNVSQDDWRRHGQERYLTGKSFHHAHFVPTDHWDHEHCRYCSAKISNMAGDLSAGYATEDKYHWVCPDCFSDFRSEMKWTLTEGEDRGL